MTERETGTDVLPMRTAIVDGEPTASDAGITALRARLIPPDDMTDSRDRILTGYERFGRLVYGPSLVGFANWICTRAAELGLDRLLLLPARGPAAGRAHRAGRRHARPAAADRRARGVPRRARPGPPRRGERRTTWPT